MPIQSTVISRKKQILQIAQSLFAEKGYAACSMRGLAAEVGIEAASLYNHYKSKEDLLRVICFERANAFLMAQQQLNQNGQSAIAQLSDAIDCHITIILENLDASAVFFKDWKSLSSPFYEDFLALRIQYETNFIQILERGIAAKEIENIDIDLYLRQLFAAMNGLHEWYQPRETQDISKIIAQILRFYIHGIAQK